MLLNALGRLDEYRKQFRHQPRSYVSLPEGFMAMRLEAEQILNDSLSRCADITLDGIPLVVIQMEPDYVWQPEDAAMC